MNLENQTALITGSSGGIGEDFAVAFAKRKANLILVARREGQWRPIDPSTLCEPICFRASARCLRACRPRRR